MRDIPVFDDVPEFAHDGTKTKPGTAKYTGGYVGGEMWPSDHANWLLNELTKNDVEAQAALLSIVTELKNLLTAHGVTPNGTLTNQLVGIFSRFVYGDSAQKTKLITDANVAVTSGFYILTSPFAHGPTATYHYIIADSSTGIGGCSQIAISVDTVKPQIYYRIQSASLWYDWITVWSSANDGAGSGLAADTSDTVMNYKSPETSQVKVPMNYLLKALRKYTTITFKQRSLPTTTSPQWWDVCWAKKLKLYCAICGNSTNIATSPDGITWTLRTLPASLNWRAVCWLEEKEIFVALAYGTSTYATSIDGITWTSRTMPVSANWTDLCWAASAGAAGILCAVAQDSSIAATSADGITWTQRTLPTSSGWTAIEWSPKLNLFCAIAYGSTVAATSPDGISWIQRTLPAASSYWASISWGEEQALFCIVARGPSSTFAATSADGITWTVQTLPVSGDWWGVSNSPELGLFLAVGPGSLLATSYDGRTWRLITSPVTANWRIGCWSQERAEFCVVANNTDVAALSA